MASRLEKRLENLLSEGRFKQWLSAVIVLSMLIWTGIYLDYIQLDISPRFYNFWTNSSITIEHLKDRGVSINRSSIVSNSTFDMSNSSNKTEHSFTYTTTAYVNGSTNLSGLYNVYADDKSNTIGNQSNLLDVPAKVSLVCVFPKVNTFEPSVMKVAGLDKKTIQCEGGYPDFVYIDGNHLVINFSKVNESIGLDEFNQCRYRHILRHEKNDHKFSSSEWQQPFTNKTEIKEDFEFLHVECTNNKSQIVSKSYWPLIPRKKELDEMDSLYLKKRYAESASKETLNIIMIALDSLPRNQFLRAMTQTYSYLTNNLTSFDFTMHSQLGDNTFPNSLPLYTGRSIEEVRKWWDDSKRLDTVDMIWRTFQKAGYRTLFAEDGPRGGAFHYLKKGFQFPFATYNIRPLALAMAGDDDIRKNGEMCVGNKLEINFLLDYVNLLLDTFPDRPVFAVLMITKMTHDDQTNAKMIDEHFLNFYKSLNQRGQLNKTLLISFSDHGCRWGAIRNSINGIFEGKTPYTILTFPNWFLTKYPEVAMNLKLNTKRLTSHFDTYATLLDLLYFKSDTPPLLQIPRHGISLFDVIPLNRTCKDAYIPSDYCLCGYENIENIDIQSDTSTKLANLVMKSLNSKIDPSLCAVLKLKQIVSILKMSLNETTSKTNQIKSEVNQTTTLYKVKLQTSPGDGIFEANVYVGNVWTVGQDIDRLNLYKGQADCVQKASDRLFCYCKNLL